MSTTRVITASHLDAATSHLSSAINAVTALEEHCAALLVYADLVAAQGLESASREMRRSLMHAITLLRVLTEELRCTALVARLAGLREPSC